MPRIVLASTSPVRRRLLADVGLDVQCVAPGVTEETEIADPVEVVRTLAVRKARAVAVVHPEAWVIGADQVVFDPDVQRAIGKPTDPSDHLARLQAFRGRTHDLVTGFSIVGPGIDVVSHVRTTLSMRGDLRDEELEAYVASGEGSGCAGGYAVEGKGAFLFNRIDGDYTNVLGLPVPALFDALRAHGWRYGS